MHRQLVAAIGGRGSWLAVLLVIAAAPPKAEGATFLSMTSQQGDFIGRGATYLFTPADNVFSVSPGPGGDGDVFVYIAGGTSVWTLAFGPPLGAALVPGVYESATRAPSASPTKPGLDVSGNGRGCNNLTGRFVVLEAQQAADGNIARLAIDFEQHCEGRAPALFGSFRYNSALDTSPRLSVSSPTAYQGDGGSLAFWASLSSPASGRVVVDYSTADETAHAGVDYTAVSGTVVFTPGETGHRIDVPVLANPVSQSSRRLTLNLSNPGGAPVAFGTGIGTLLDDGSRTLLFFDGEAGESIAPGQAFTLTPLDGVIAAQRQQGSRDGVVLSFFGESAWTMSFAAPSGTPFAPGTYEGATRFPSDPAKPGLDVSGNGVGCNDVSGRFVVLEADFSGGPGAPRLAIDFEQHCDGEQPALLGSLRYRSTIPASRCMGAAHTLCLGRSRFKVRATFDAGARSDGSAHVVDLTNDTGYFWFFASPNVEAVIKVLDGCSVNGHYWVFAGGLTNVKVTTTATDTQNGITRTYVNPPDTPFVPLQDTLAFSNCP